MKKVVSTIICAALIPTFAASKDPIKFNYMASLSGKYDSNIGQNIMEEGMFYLSPALGVQWYPAKGNIYTRLDMAYELHVQDRAPKYNEPLLDVGVGGELRSGIFRWTPELSGALWYANDVQKVWDTTGQVLNFQLAQREIVFNSPIKFITKSNWFIVGMKYSLTDEIGEANDASEILLEPSWSYRFPMKKKKAVQFKSTGIETAVDINIAKEETNSYTEGELGPQMTLRLGKKGSLKLAGTYARRLYGGTVADPQSSDTIQELCSYWNVGTFLDVPVVSDLHIQAGGKLRFKESNISYDEFDRHTLFLRIKWDHTAEKAKSNDRQDQNIQDWKSK